jgi:protocatechuate 3,4-dioxygenase beta subunit
MIIGLHVTDAKGQATFFTIYPGWYNGRATHIHIKVHINGTYVDVNGVYTGGHVSHTGEVNDSWNLI